MIYRQSAYSTPILPLNDLVDSKQTAQLYEYRAQRQFIQCLTSAPMLSLLLSVLPQSHCSSLHTLVLTLLVHLGWRLSPVSRKTFSSHTTTECDKDHDSQCLIHHHSFIPSHFLPFVLQSIRFRNETCSTAKCSPRLDAKV